MSLSCRPLTPFSDLRESANGKEVIVSEKTSVTERQESSLISTGCIYIVFICMYVFLIFLRSEGGVFVCSLKQSASAISTSARLAVHGGAAR